MLLFKAKYWHARIAAPINPLTAPFILVDLLPKVLVSGLLFFLGKHCVSPTCTEPWAAMARL